MMNKIFNIKHIVNNIIRNGIVFNFPSKNISKMKVNDRYDGYNFHDFMDKLSNEGAF